MKIKMIAALKKTKEKRSSQHAVTRTLERGIVTLLGNQLKTGWEIGIHWLTAIKNMLAKPMINDVIINLAIFKQELC